VARATSSCINELKHADLAKLLSILALEGGGGASVPYLVTSKVQLLQTHLHCGIRPKPVYFVIL